MLIKRLFILQLLLLFWAFSFAQTVYNQYEYDKETVNSGAQLGYSVAVYGDYAVIGVPGYSTDQYSNQGIAYIYHIDDIGNWVLVATLQPPTSQAGAKFGFSVSISQNYIAIGAPYYDANGYTDVGAVYVYYSSDGTWSGTLTHDDLIPQSQEDNLNFGYSVSITTILVVGAPGYDQAKGGVAVFEDQGGNSWQQTATLTRSLAQPNDSLGASVDVWLANTIVAGAPNVNNGTGAAYIYQISGSWTDMPDPSAELTPSNLNAGDHFGVSVAIDSFVVVGADKGDACGQNEGAAFVFQRPESGWSGQVSQSYTLSTSNFSSTNQSLAFGRSVDIYEKKIIVGAPGDNNGQGAAYVFAPPYTGSTRTENFILRSDYAPQSLGQSVAIGQKQIIIGSPMAEGGTGHAFVYIGPYKTKDPTSFSDLCGDDTINLNAYGVLVNQYQWNYKKQSASEYTQTSDTIANFSGSGTRTLTIRLDHTFQQCHVFCHLTNYYPVTNKSTNTDTVTIGLETTPPTITVNNTYHHYYLNKGGVAKLQFSDYATVSDNCAIADTVFLIGLNPRVEIDYATCDDLNKVKAFWLSATDVSGNTTNTFDQYKYETHDTISPTFDVSEDELYLNDTGYAALNPDIIIHNVFDNCAVTDTIFSQKDFYCRDLGDDTITVTVTDLSANYVAKKTIIHVNDYVWPTLVLKPGTVDVYLDSNGIVVPYALIDTAYDNCSIVDTIADTLTCMALNKTVDVNVKVIDEFGNETPKQGSVHVVDTIKPYLKTHVLNVYLDSTGVDTLHPYMVIDSLWDNCTVVDTFFGSHEIVTANCGTLSGTIVGMLNAVDDAGNQISKVYMYNTYDTLSPVLTCPQDTTVAADASGYYTVLDSSLDARAWDNCSIDTLFNRINDSTTLKGHAFSPGVYDIVWIAKDKSANTDSCSFRLTVTGTSTNLNTLSRGVRLYPNPVKKVLFVEFPEFQSGQIRIFDQLGRLVYMREFNATKFTINTNSYPPGVYMVRIRLKDRTIERKFIKH